MGVHDRGWWRLQVVSLGTGDTRVCVWVGGCVCACIGVWSGFTLPLCEPTAGQGLFVALCARHMTLLLPCRGDGCQHC